jgi:hypothetical protein
MLLVSYPHQHDMGKLQGLAMQGRAELERLFEEDEITQRQTWSLQTTWAPAHPDGV